MFTINKTATSEDLNDRYCAVNENSATAMIITRILCDRIKNYDLEKAFFICYSSKPDSPLREQCVIAIDKKLASADIGEISNLLRNFNQIFYGKWSMTDKLYDAFIYLAEQELRHCDIYRAQEICCYANGIYEELEQLAFTVIEYLAEKALEAATGKQAEAIAMMFPRQHPLKQAALERIAFLCNQKIIEFQSTGH